SGHAGRGHRRLQPACRARRGRHACPSRSGFPMRRRDFLTVISGAPAFLPRMLRAQQKAMPVIGYLTPNPLGPGAPFVAAFRQGLSETDYVEGQSVLIEYRYAEGDYDRLPALAADLVRRKVD